MSRTAPAAGHSALQSSSSAPTLPRPPLADLLVANLRLLDLDTRDDWPDITSKTFSLKDAQQNQKQRIKCTEWVLYRLFELWDPEETKDKMGHLFPPMEPLQSLNLRGALFRCLNELKKNGVLGKETVLRKTMLDECKGEKLMELIVVFSTVVLKGIDQARHTQAPSRAYAIATAPILNAVQQGSLIPLAIAHTASLSNTIKKRQEKKQRLAQFNDLLDGKRSQLRERVKACVQSRRRESNVNEEAQVKKAVVDNWNGSNSWSQVLLSGDETTAGDLPLQKPFPEVWAAVSEGQPLNGDPNQMGLLAGLDSRVRMQKERMQMWQDFFDSLKESSEVDNARIKREQKLGPTAGAFAFNRHQHLQLGNPKAQANDMESEDNFYGALVKDLREELASASKSRRGGGKGLTTLKRGGDPVYTNHEHDIFSPVKNATIPTASDSEINKPPRNMASAATLDPLNVVRPTLLVPAAKANGLSAARGANKPEMSIDVKKLAKPDPVASPTPDVMDYPSFTEVLVRETPRKEAATPKIKAPDSPPEEEEETAADRIISSVVNATPSPVKQMTLTERTRMSMAYFPPKDVPQSLDSGIAMTDEARDEDEAAPVNEKANRRVSLMDRTRLSMAQVASHPNNVKSRKSSKRESRMSLFPINQFETPGKPKALPSPRRDATPTEKLFSDDAEYASIFKSRPRIAMSPVFSPEEGDHGEFGDETILGSDVDDESTEMMDEGTYAISPLRRKGVA